MCTSLRTWGGGLALTTFSLELDLDNKSSTAIEARFCGGERLTGDLGGGPALADWGLFVLGRVVPLLLKAAMSCVASSSELMLATAEAGRDVCPRRYTVVEGLWGYGGFVTAKHVWPRSVVS